MYDKHESSLRINKRARRKHPLFASDQIITTAPILYPKLYLNEDKMFESLNALKQNNILVGLRVDFLQDH